MSLKSRVERPTHVDPRLAASARAHLDEVDHRRAHRIAAAAPLAERGHRLVRSRSCHPYRSHEAMYREFGRRILLDLPGDTVRSVVTSGRAVLDLAALVDARG